MDSDAVHAGDQSARPADVDAASALQPTRNAGQASCSRSSLQPGSASNATRRYCAGSDGAAAGAGAGFSGGTVAQPASNANAANEQRARGARRRNPAIMGWFFLESLFALVVAVAIVWWTMGPRKRKPPRDR